jgi:predicted DNA-binding transcriptional regulator AlpA
MDDKLLKRIEVQELLKVSVRKFYENIITDTTFPKPFRLANTKTKLYSLREINDWVELQKEKNRVIKTA